ncbi:T9SS sorting signal type C domain-containing protein [Flavobacterium sp. WC2509]|uniref:T9SS sorting signal type C domain-containing protein n=1 Tax=Flavobacterium sp. WC2509 TaxID=3461406 RepID=UPI0040447B1B
MSKITQNYFQEKSKRTTKGLSLFVLLLIGTQMSWGQKQIIGSFPAMEGGFEVTPYTIVTNGNSTIPTAQWQTNASSFTAAFYNASTDASNVRTGIQSLSISNTGNSKYLTSPNAVLSPLTEYTVQYFIKYTSDVTNTVASPLLTGAVSATAGPTTYDGTLTTGIWIKAYKTVITIDPVKSNSAGLNGKTATTATAAYLDDLVLYQGPYDATAPDAPKAQTVSGLNVSWTAPDNGVDGGGYLVVRYSTSPNASNIPNANGIYAKGNTITNGGKTGTVVYTGIATLFTDDVPGSVSGSDYYEIFTVDKAFNYSTNLVIASSAALKVDSQSFNENKVIVYKKDGVLNVNSTGSNINNIKVYDIQGKLLAEQKNLNSNTVVIKNLKATNQILIVKITSEDNLEVIKKVAN